MEQSAPEEASSLIIIKIRSQVKIELLSNLSSFQWLHDKMVIELINLGRTIQMHLKFSATSLLALFLV
jgi:hypothetical protein